MVTVWSKRAQAELQKAYLYIRLDSLQNAEMVRDEIIDLTIDLCNYPTKYPVDKFKKDNDEPGGRLRSTIIGSLIGLPKIKYVSFACGIPADLRWFFDTRNLLKN